MNHAKRLEFLAANNSLLAEDEAAQTIILEALDIRSARTLARQLCQTASASANPELVARATALHATIQSRLVESREKFAKTPAASAYFSETLPI